MKTSRDNSERQLHFNVYSLPFLSFSKQMLPRLALLFLAPMQLWNMLTGILNLRRSPGSNHKLKTIQESNQQFIVLAKVLVTYFQQATLESYTFLPMAVEIQRVVHFKSLYPVSNFRNLTCPEPGHL